MDKIILFQTGLVPTLITVSEDKVSPVFCWGQAEALDLDEMIADAHAIDMACKP